MNPIFIKLGPLTIRYYGLFAAIGCMLGLMLLNKNRKYATLSSDDVYNLIFIAMVTGCIGARIFYVIQFFDQFRNNLVDIIRIDKGGLVFYGGFFLALISVVIYALIKKIDVIRMFDVMGPSLAIGHASGRVGCFFNGCCFGNVTNSFLGVHYPVGSEAYLKYGAVAVHPVQLYEAFFNIVICIICIILLRKYKRGISSGFYFIAYGLMRFLNEFIRGDHNLDNMSFTVAQIIGFCILPAGIIYFVTFVMKRAEQKGEELNVK